MTEPNHGESSGPRRRPRRRHPALASRIAVTGMSTATMLGIVAILGGTGTSDDADQSADTVPAPSPTLPSEPATTATVTPGSTTFPAPITTSVSVTELANEPIQLTANPVVRIIETPATAAAAPSAPAPAPQEQAPVASTNGSR